MLIKRFSETAVLPRRATEGSAGYDLSADLAAPEVIRPGESKLLPTGIGVALPPQTAGLVFGRSGLGAKHGIVPANAVGVIDWDYRGEIKVPLRNQGSEPYTVVPVQTPELTLTDDLGSSERGEKGFGSSGRN